MKSDRIISLSTNWCNRRIERGDEIAAKARELGFGELELGFHTTDTQAAEILKCGILPIGSVHAFCPVPISAPCGYPELYQLASFDDESRAMARFQIRKNIAFAAEVGADALVLHSGRIRRGGWFEKRRIGKMTGIFKHELELLLPELESHKVTLGLENMPYVEGFPNEKEIGEVVGEWVRPWFDTGHWFARSTRRRAMDPRLSEADFRVWASDPGPGMPVGCHVNDSLGGDDHLPPGEGKIDFAALKEVFAGARHLVFEPNDSVSDDQLKAGLSVFRSAISSL